MIHLGRPMRVRIVAVNVTARQLSVAPAEPLGQGREAPAPKKRARKARVERKPKKLKKKRRK
jgi:hypothetical protein